MLLEIRLYNGFVKATIMLLLENPCKINITLSFPPLSLLQYIFRIFHASYITVLFSIAPGTLKQRPLKTSRSFCHTGKGLVQNKCETVFLYLSPWFARLLFPSHRHVGKDFECQQYIKNARKKNIGCHMKKISFQQSKKIKLNITVRDLRNNSRRLSYYKAFTPETIGKYCLLLPIMKS